MIFQQGFVHCDPHPGNIFIRPRPSFWYKFPFLAHMIPGLFNFEIVLLDHGLYRTLTDEFRLDYAKLWNALIKSDEPDIEKYSYRLFLHGEKVCNDGIDHHRLFASMLTGRSWEAITCSTGPGLASTRTSEELNMISTKVTQGAFLIAISDILAKLPRELLLLLKTNDLLRAVDESLQVMKSNQNHALSLVNIMGWYCAYAIWTESTRTLISQKPYSYFTDYHYWNRLLEFYRVASRLVLLNLYIEFKKISRS
jgi:aarF domain-containing kinase